jgi:hypothetical protein
MGTDSTEGLITAQWDYPRLRDLWAQDEFAIRAAMPVAEAGRVLSAVYARKLSIDEAVRIPPPGEASLSLPGPHESPAAPELSPGETPLLAEADWDPEEMPSDEG